MNIRKQAPCMSAIPAVLVAFLVCVNVARAGETLIGKVPFEFTVGQKTLPAGEYAFEIDRLSPGTVLVRSTESTASAIALSRRAGDTVIAGAPFMEFNVYGQRRFISLIRTGERAAVSIGQGALERSLAKAGVRPSVALVQPTAARPMTRF